MNTEEIDTTLDDELDELDENIKEEEEEETEDSEEEEEDDSLEEEDEEEVDEKDLKIKELEKKVADAEKTKRQTKRALNKKTKSEDSSNLKPTDLYALMEAKIPREDIESVVKASKLLNKSISETIKDPVMAGILKTKQEYRETAKATQTKSGRPSSKKLSDSELLSRVGKGEIPEAGSEEAERLFNLRRNR